jgi:hypothetical protein
MRTNGVAKENETQRLTIYRQHIWLNFNTKKPNLQIKIMSYAK